MFKPLPETAVSWPAADSQHGIGTVEQTFITIICVIDDVFLYNYFGLVLKNNMIKFARPDCTAHTVPFVNCCELLILHYETIRMYHLYNL